jgi:DNA-binding LacI/PurR family transcriptional regulator
MLRVPLTTVSWSRQDQGQQAAQLLLARLDVDDPGSDAPRRVIIPPRLVVRESCGAARSVGTRPVAMERSS